jgi:uncharacterized iron-regulated membrane protein
VSAGKSFKKIYKLHVYVGVFVAVHFTIFALSGLFLLFKAELQGEAASNSRPLTPWETSSFYERALANANTSYPGDRALALYPDDNDPNLLHFRLGQNGATKLRGARKVTFNAETGRELKEAPSSAKGFFDWLLLLHRELFLGSWGKIYVGIVGLAYIFLLLSGFYIYGNFMRGRSFGELRTKLIPRLLDFHKSAAAVTFGWSLVVGLSGVLLAFNGLLIKIFQFISLRHLQAAYAGQASATQSAPLGQVIQSALAAKPDWVVTYVSFPDTEFSVPGHFLLLLNGTQSLTKRLSELAVVNAQSGKLVEIIELPLYLKVVLLSEPLHFGDYGGLFLKSLWAIFTLGSLAVALLGITSFFLKRRERTRAEATYVPMKSRLTFAGPVTILSVLALISIAGVAGALVFEDKGGLAAASFLLIPIILFFTGAKRDA